MQEEIEDVQGTNQVTRSQHLQLFPYVGFGRKGHQPKKQGSKNQEPHGDFIYPFHWQYSSMTARYTRASASVWQQ